MIPLPATALKNIRIDDVSVFFAPNIIVHVLRLDLIHPFISGNKWFKLFPYLELVRKEKKKGLVSFGGAWSNHLLATAVACQQEGWQSIGLVRGEKSSTPSNTMMQAAAAGMKLYYLSRDDYRHKIIPQDLMIDDFLLVDEGGYGIPGAKGAAGILKLADQDYSHYCAAVGTGTTLAGLIMAAKPGQQITGISVMKNNLGLEEAVNTLIENKSKNWQINHEFHFGGYAKHPPELLAFINHFYQVTGIPSDIVYTGKLFYGIKDLVTKGYFPENSRVLVIHTGGIQGNSSLPNGTLMF